MVTFLPEKKLEQLSVWFKCILRVGPTIPTTTAAPSAGGPKHRKREISHKQARDRETA